jgi:hypothetical protein
MPFYVDGRIAQPWGERTPCGPGARWPPRVDEHLTVAGRERNPCSVGWTILGQAAQALRDEELVATVTSGHGETLMQAKWLLMRLKEAAPQALVFE